VESIDAIDGSINSAYLAGQHKGNSMSHASRTPADLVIHPRNVTFTHPKDTRRWWNGGDPVASAFFNSLSISFPPGEAFFIKSVRYFRNAVPAQLRSQIDDFIRQEAAHSREHASFNDLAKDSGYDTRAMEADLTTRLARTKDNAPAVNLAMTVALEHFTAIMAHASLEDDRYVRAMSPDTAALWKWHAIEEIEHKAVAYDVFVEVTQKMSGFKRWALRSIVMLRVSQVFVQSRLSSMRGFFKQDGINTLRTWLRVFHYLLVFPGTFRQIFLPWLSFFRPRFHPWDIDDRALLEAHEAKLRALPSYHESLSSVQG
jgi:predicted metal-dependent hydrolase